MKNFSLKREIAAVFVVTAGILSIPLIGMQISNEWNWSLSDFIIAGTLLIATGLLIVFTSRKVKKFNKRIAIIAAILMVLIFVWAHLAVGLVDTWPLAGS